MISFAKYIVEVKAEPYPYKWNKLTYSDANAEFITSNGSIIVYDVELHYEDAGYGMDEFEHHEIVFRGGKKGSLTTDKIDTGNPFRVFATIEALTKEFIDRFGNRIEMIKFSAAKGDGELGRSNLYKRFGKNWQKTYPRYNWQPYVLEQSDKTYLYIVNKDVMSDENKKMIVQSRFRLKLKKL